MLPLHLAPSMLVLFMVMLAVVPLGIIWLDERRGRIDVERLARLREDVGLREQLARVARNQTGRRAIVFIPEA